MRFRVLQVLLEVVRGLGFMGFQAQGAEYGGLLGFSSTTWQRRKMYYISPKKADMVPVERTVVFVELAAHEVQSLS